MFGRKKPIPPPLPASSQSPAPEEFLVSPDIEGRIQAALIPINAKLDALAREVTRLQALEAHFADSVRFKRR